MKKSILLSISGTHLKGVLEELIALSRNYTVQTFYMQYIDDRDYPYWLGSAVAYAREDTEAGSVLKDGRL